MESAWCPGVGELLLGASLGLNLLCLYLIWARLYAEPVPAPGRAPALPPTAWPGKERGCRAGTQPDMEEKELSQLAEFESFSEEDDLTTDSEEVEKEEEKNPRQLRDMEITLKRELDQRVTEAGRLCQSRNQEEDYLLFLYKFPAQKVEIEKCISCLRETAEAISKTYKDCRIANITASSAGLTSGILTILGLTLTPITAGGSLILTATGLGLGAAAATTGVSAQISEHVINSKHSKRSQELIKTCKENLNKCMESLATMLGLNEIELDTWSCSSGKELVQENLEVVLSGGAQQIPKVVNTVRGIKANVQALQLARANPGLKLLAKQATAAGKATRASLKGVEQVEAAFKGTALALSKGARIMGAVTAGLFILYDTVSIVQDAIQLAKRATPEMATKIRDEASKLEEALQNLSELHEQLKERHSLQS